MIPSQHAASSRGAELTADHPRCPSCNTVLTVTKLECEQSRQGYTEVRDFECATCGEGTTIVYRTLQQHRVSKLGRPN
jgi:uncharacterized protein with PIN domain